MFILIKKKKIFFSSCVCVVYQSIYLFDNICVVSDVHNNINDDDKLFFFSV